MLKLTTIGLFSVLAVFSLVKPALAQEAKKKAPETDLEASQKAIILSSDRWKQVQKQFDEWMSVQVVFTPQQAEEYRAKLKAQAQNMSAEELEAFLSEWAAKLEVLRGKDATEARAWLGQNLSIMADGFRKEFLPHRPRSRP